MAALDSFHPLVAGWFRERFGAPTEPQEQGWQHIATGAHTLIAAPTGSGKTLAAFLWGINRLVELALRDQLENRTQLIYLSPLKALGNDIERNLQAPLAEILERAARVPTLFGEQLRELKGIRVAVRSGDTTMADRARMRRQPPHILITTPESLFILLTAQSSRKFLATARTVIVDEIHAVAGDKRGAHLALSLERLDELCGHRLQRIGLSATQKPIEQIARLLTGAAEDRGSKLKDHGPLPCSILDLQSSIPCAIVDTGHRRDLDLTVEVPDQKLGPIPSNELRGEVIDRIVGHVQRHRTTIVFVNTRRLVERIAHELTERLGEGKVAAHHGSMAKEARLAAERKLKTGEVPVVVATASLELGIDIGHVDLVCHFGAPRSLATLLQRVGRAGHWLGAVPKGILFPLTRDELIQCAAAVRAVGQGELDRIIFPRKPLDILAQQLVALAAFPPTAAHDSPLTNGWPVEALWDFVRRAFHYRELTRKEFDEVLEMLAEGVSSTRGRRGAHLHFDRVNGLVRARRGAQLAAVTSGGAIPEVADYEVVEESTGAFVGRVNEDFAIKSMAGEVFLLGNSSWRIRRVEAGRLRVESAHGANPTVPFWIGEAPARTQELSLAVCSLREEVAQRLKTDAAAWLVREAGLGDHAAQQIIEYVRATVAVLGVVPTQQTVVAERFFDEAGGMQLVLHTPFGGRVNRAWGFALRKRFCLTFDFELQAAATDDGVVLSLGEAHSFPLDNALRMIRLSTLREDLIQAMLISPMFGNRWRWNATRALALLRFQNGRKVPMPIQRMRSDDLLAAVFPDQVACQDNHAGPIMPPDHPLVNETVDNCLYEAMDLESLRSIVERIESGVIRAVAIETPMPSPMCHEILNSNPYSFLDDAPLEERRARAVNLRRIAPDLAGGIGALDPEAIATVRQQAWPDLRDADELHDFLLTVGLLPMEELDHWCALAEALIAARRATTVRANDGFALLAAERISLVRALFGNVPLAPPIEPPPGCFEFAEREEALTHIVQGWLEAVGPTTARELAERLALRKSDLDIALGALETRGVVMQGKYTGASDEVEWCERRLLARIHRLTIGKLRREIEPVSSADFLRFLFRWQHVAPGTQLHGRDGLLSVIGQLQGVELPAAAWEKQVLAARVAGLTPFDLEQLCLAGVVTWGRGSQREAPAHEESNGHSNGNEKRRGRTAPARNAPLAFLRREDLPWLLRERSADESVHENLSASACLVAEYLDRRGASFIADLVAGTGQVTATVEDALWELVSRGLVTGDGIAGLRVLLQPDEKRRNPRLLPVGRWSLWRRAESVGGESRDRIEPWAHQLLKRYGVVFRDLLARETLAPRWSELVRVYRRLEARGELRGGRFVQCSVGEQFALPEALEALRCTRRIHVNAEIVLVASADPLNLVGIITPGARISPQSTQMIAYRDGVPIEVGTLGSLRSRLQPVVITAR